MANFVETEQIVEFQGDRASFVQIRGSIPLFWQQLPDLRYKPPPQLQDVAMEEHLSACIRHLETAGILYGRQVKRKPIRYLTLYTKQRENYLHTLERTSCIDTFGSGGPSRVGRSATERIQRGSPADATVGHAGALRAIRLPRRVPQDALGPAVHTDGPRGYRPGRDGLLSVAARRLAGAAARRRVPH